MTNSSTLGALAPHHLSYLQDRAVDPRLAVQVGFRSVDATEATDLLDYPAPSGLLMPYPNQPAYHRLRTDDGGPRYLCPKETPVPVYIAFAPDDATQRLLVVESPVKALAAIGCGYQAVGLGGTGTTLETAGTERRLGPSWVDLSLDGREVVIVFDSNRANNPAVARDEARLAMALERAGALARVAEVPSCLSGDLGPDDLIAKEGAQRFTEVVDAAKLADPAERVICAINAEPETQAGMIADLLGDLTFLIAVHERGVACERTVRDLLCQVNAATDFKQALAQARRVLKQHAKQQAAAESVIQERYCVVDGCLAMIVPTKDGPTAVPLTNFNATITTDIVIDDGAEVVRQWVIEGARCDGVTLPSFAVAPAALATPTWAAERWGSPCYIHAGRGYAEHVRVAMQAMSDPLAIRRFKYTGWLPAEHGDGYLHAGGAVGAFGHEVQLDGLLAKYRLPEASEDVEEAVRLSLRLLEVGPATATYALFAAMYRAPTADILPVDFVLLLLGRSGAMKTTLALLFLGHYGSFQATDLMSWSSTANAIESFLHSAKDVPAVIDDFAPVTSEHFDEVRRKFARVVRDVGNVTARRRLRSDLVARPGRPPRGLVISTGEDAPSGESLAARTLPAWVPSGQVDVQKLTELQNLAHRLPHAMRRYIEWLRPRRAMLANRMRVRYEELRQQLRVQEQHLRAPAAVANLQLGLELFSEFARDLGVFDHAAAEFFVSRGSAALQEAARLQTTTVQDHDPVRTFLETLQSLLVRGKAVLLSDAQDPAQHGDRFVGWRVNKGIYLEPKAAYGLVRQALRDEGRSMPLQASTLWTRLDEAGVVCERDKDRVDAKRSVGGRRPRVIHLRGDALDGGTMTSDCGAITKLRAVVGHPPIVVGNSTQKPVSEGEGS